MKSIDVSQSIFTALASKFFMGAIHSLHKYIQALNRNSSTAQTTMMHEEQVHLVGCTRTFSKQKNIRVMCDASHDALSDNFTHNRDKNSTNKLRMLSVVWSAEFFSYYSLKQSKLRLSIYLLFAFVATKMFYSSTFLPLPNHFLKIDETKSPLFLKNFEWH